MADSACNANPANFQDVLLENKSGKNLFYVVRVEPAVLPQAL